MTFVGGLESENYLVKPLYDECGILEWEIIIPRIQGWYKCNVLTWRLSTNLAKENTICLVSNELH